MIVKAEGVIPCLFLFPAVQLFFFLYNCISLNVFSEAESKSFLGVSGAEKLKGQGDMLYRRPGTPQI